MTEKSHSAKTPDADLPYPKKLRVVLADDDRIILGLVRNLLAEAYDVVGQAEDGRKLVETVNAQQPDLAIIDVSMPGLSGIEATRAIRAADRGVRVILLSIHDEQAYVEAAFEAGASGYVLKISASTDLIPAIETVRSNGRYLSPRLR
jgi:DNA-binding NarL/FixJ family response regulator